MGGLSNAIGGLLGIAIVADVAGKVITKNKVLNPKPAKVKIVRNERRVKW